MFCEKCGHELSKEGAFCSNCGASVGKYSNLQTDIMETSKKRRKKRLWLAIMGCIVALILMATILLLIHSFSRHENVWEERENVSEISSTVSDKDDDKDNNISSVSDDLETNIDSSSAEDEEDNNIGLYNLTEQNTLVVAISANFEPFLYVQDGEIVGFEAELIECIALEMGLKVEYRNIDFDNIINDIENNKADIGISLIVPTSLRREKVDFSETYFFDFSSGDEYAIAIGKDSNLLETINKTIIRLINNGKIDELKQKYNITTINWTS